MFGMPVPALVGLALLAVVGGLLLWTRLVRPMRMKRERDKNGSFVPPAYDLGDGGGGSGGGGGD